MYTVIQETRNARGERLILHCPNIVNLCIDAYDGEKQCGRLYHQYTDREVPFRTIFEALERMERLYDVLQYPQPATRIRSFAPESGAGERRPGSGNGAEGSVQETGTGRKQAQTFDTVVGHRGEQASFLVYVQFRQCSSWQGELTWMEGRQRKAFRSVLELLRLIDSAATARGEGRAESDSSSGERRVRREKEARAESGFHGK